MRKQTIGVTLVLGALCAPCLATRQSVVADRMLTKAGNAWVNPKTGKKMIRVKGGVIRPRLPRKALAVGTGGFTVTFTDGTKEEVSRYSPLPGSPAYVEDFLMDDSPVSNAEFYRYVNATKAAPPKSWEGPTPPIGEEAAPAGVTYAQASAYAKWAGLRLPSVYEFCAGVSDKDGLFPWADKLGDKLKGDKPLMEDVSPRGLRGLANSPLGLWGLETGADGWQLAFMLAFMDKDDLVLTYRSDPAKTYPYFRCVDDSISIPAMIANTGSRTGALETVMCAVTIINTLSQPVRVGTSSGFSFVIPGNQRQDVSLPIGAHLVTFSSEGGGPSVSRVMRAYLHQDPRSLVSAWPRVGFKYEWTITEVVGEPLSR